MEGANNASRASNYFRDCNVVSKRFHNEWRTTLSNTTKNGLQMIALDEEDLSVLNGVGVYHRFGEGAGNPKQEFDQLHKTPIHWIYRGTWPGIWCALFAAENTYTIITGTPIIARLEFSEGFKLYDPRNKDHQQKWAEWIKIAANREQPNPWASQINGQGQRMDERMAAFVGDATHAGFFQEYHFGASIGYSDYMAIVIINAEVVQSLSMPAL